MTKPAYETLVIKDHMTSPLAALSDSISRLAAFGAPLLTAIRIGPNRHITGLLCPEGAIVTTDQALPAFDSYTIVLANRSLVPARPGARDSSSNLAVLQLEAPVQVSLPENGTPALGSMAVLLGADIDASPTVRLALVHRLQRTAGGPSAVLDLLGGEADPGSIVLDADGRLIGMAAPGASGEVVVVPYGNIGRMLKSGQSGAGHLVSPQTQPSVPGPSANRRGWLGVALQPITVPDQLIGRVGQTSGRMVVNITTGGPADRAGMRVGDVLLSLNGGSVSAQNSLRAFLAEERIGSEVEIKLLRDGSLITTHLTVAIQP